MEFRCSNCGFALAAPPPGQFVPCPRCGAQQGNPYGGAWSPPAGPSPSPYGQPIGAPPTFGAPPGGFGASPPPYEPAPFGPPPRTNPAVALIAVIPVALLVLGAAGFVLLRRAPAAPAASASGSGAGMTSGTLATLSLAQTPESMAKITGVAPESDISGVSMRVPLQGMHWTTLRLEWDPADLSHAKEATLDADSLPAEDAAIRQRFATIFGRRLEKGGQFYWNDTWVDYEGKYARVMASVTSGSEKRPEFAAACDAGWKVLRSAVLNLGAGPTEAEERAYLGRGYTLATLAQIDPGVDVDHAKATVSPLLPGGHWSVMIGLRLATAVDDPLFGQAELVWKDAKGGKLESIDLDGPPDSKGKLPDQAGFEACIQAAYGKPYKVYEGDHLKGDHRTEWRPREGGELRVSEDGAMITLVSAFTPAHMSRAGYQKALGVLAQCAAKR